MPADFGEVWALAELLWQREVGTHHRAKERAEVAEAAKQSRDYRKSVAALKRQQE